MCRASDRPATQSSLRFSFGFDCRAAAAARCCDRRDRDPIPDDGDRRQRRRRLSRIVLQLQTLDGAPIAIGTTDAEWKRAATSHRRRITGNKRKPSAERDALDGLPGDAASLQLKTRFLGRGRGVIGSLAGWPPSWCLSEKRATDHGRSFPIVARPADPSSDPPLDLPSCQRAACLVCFPFGPAKQTRTHTRWRTSYQMFIYRTLAALAFKDLSIRSA